MLSRKGRTPRVMLQVRAQITVYSMLLSKCCLTVRNSRKTICSTTMGFKSRKITDLTIRGWMLPPMFAPKNARVYGASMPTAALEAGGMTVSKSRKVFSRSSGISVIYEVASFDGVALSNVASNDFLGRSVRVEDWRSMGRVVSFSAPGLRFEFGSLSLRTRVDAFKIRM